MASGGANRGQGRKPVAEELNTRLLSQAAIIAKYGSLEKGLQSLLNSDRDPLIKFVFEHALGKPVDKVEAKVDGEVIHIRFRDAE
jgi:protoporphyrinogen oxidase